MVFASQSVEAHVAGWSIRLDTDDGLLADGEREERWRTTGRWMARSWPVTVTSPSGCASTIWLDVDARLTLDTSVVVGLDDRTGEELVSGLARELVRAVERADAACSAAIIRRDGSFPDAIATLEFLADATGIATATTSAARTKGGQHESRV
jgi:hypothetical protein